ncbi:hypothetical protein [Aquimarina sp. RZ0]|uniref:hypothetical protein n=1 Tax=Aquimarina sp. RZ0 TaxID=2607730 RepID=UPI0011F1191B|nr:hypothetical protein [Aquimarina sp. RZ0]KAA1247431.1 hypothetical protein F0000_02935 [Aquimarina sp. RZ0]
MNRRKFLFSGTIGLGTTSIFPSSIISNDNTISIFSIGKGFTKISGQIHHLPVAFLSKNLAKTHVELVNLLDDKGYTYNNSEVVKLSNSCFIIPLIKKPLIGFYSKELAMLIKHNGIYNYYILKEQTALAFNSLIENFIKSSKSQGLHLDALTFITPNRIIKESYGKENTFTYKNAIGNTITLKGSTKRQIAIIS